MLNATPQTGVRETPMRTVIEQNRERGVEPWARRELPWGILGGLAALGVVAAVIAWRLRRGSRRAQPAAERAFLQVSKKLKLDHSSRLLLRELAVECEEEPLALVVSPGALRAALSRVDRRKWEQRRGWRRIIELDSAA